MTDITDLDPNEIREVVHAIEPMVWMKDDRVICISNEPLLIRTFCEVGSIPITDRFDTWSALAEPFLDTELSPRAHETILAMLKENGFEETEVKEIRSRIEPGLFAATVASWEWQYYGLGDVRQHCGILRRLLGGAAAFERWTSEIASRAWKRDIASGKPTKLVPAYEPPRHGLKARMRGFPNLIEPSRTGPVFGDFKSRFEAEETIIEKATCDLTATTRHYHNLRHLEEALELGGESLRTQRGIQRLSQWYKSRGYRNLWWAILFHDAIYVPGRADNEQLSAELAVETMRRHGLAERDCKQVSDIIMWTRHHDCRELNSPELKAMHDGDLGIFGLWPARYDDYRIAVRREWIDGGVVDEPQFNQGRFMFLEKVLEQHRGRPFYFGLNPLFSKLAEENIRGEIDSLRKVVG